MTEGREPPRDETDEDAATRLLRLAGLRASVSATRAARVITSALVAAAAVLLAIGWSALIDRGAPPGHGHVAVVEQIEGPAMSEDELACALGVGLDVADGAASDGVAVIACGDMGIGNTTAASAMTAAFLRVAAAEVTGPGTGIDTEMLARKIDVVSCALAANQPGRDPLAILRTVGGLDIAAIAGAYVGAAAHRIAIVGDGFMATAAALVAASVCPTFLDYWFAGHRSSEPGHALQLRFLRQPSLLELEMRLGEGTGAALAMHLFGAAAAVMNEMATFDRAGVAGREEGPAPEAVHS